jgi:calicheamicin 4-deoxy-4-thio-alpha-D-digitoxosyltransferase
MRSLLRELSAFQKSREPASVRQHSRTSAPRRGRAAPSVLLADERPAARYRIVVLNAPAESQTRSVLPIVRELRRRGHRMTYVTTREFAPSAAATGVDVLVHDSCPTLGVDANPEDCGPADARLVADALDWAEEVDAAFRDDDPPDLVLYETSVHATARFLTCRWSRPAVQILPSFAHRAQAAAEAGASLESTDVDDGSCARRLPGHIRERLYRFLTPGGMAGGAPSNFYTKPEPLSIALLPREFQTDGELFDGSVAFVGTCTPECGVIDQWIPPSTDLPVVFLALDPELIEGGRESLRACVSALAEKSLHVVVLTPNGESESLFAADGPPLNVELHDHVPWATVLRRAAVFVCHSDLHSVMESLYFNTALVAVPTSHRQRAVADRVVELDLGARVSPDRAALGTLADVVTALVADPGIARSVREGQRWARNAGGALRAADEIERFLEWSYEP